MKNNKTDLYQFVDKVKHAVGGLKHTEQYDLPAFLTSMLTACLPKSLQIEWKVHSRESRDVPPLEEFLQFVSFRADVLSTTPTAPPESKPTTSDSKSDHAPRKHRATVHSNAARPSSSGTQSMQGFRYECMLCPIPCSLVTCSMK